MACEACKAKFTLFKRKKQCMDCLVNFCGSCVIRRYDKVLSCDNCSMLSRRPLIKCQILQLKSRHLRQYLEAKKVSVRGCIEKEDLVNLLMRYANGNEVQNNGINEQRSTIPEYSTPSQRNTNFSPNLFESSYRSRSPPTLINANSNQPEILPTPESSHISENANSTGVTNPETTNSTSSSNTRRKQCHCDPSRHAPHGATIPNSNLCNHSDSPQVEVVEINDANEQSEPVVEFSSLLSEEVVVEHEGEPELINVTAIETRVEFEELLEGATSANPGPEPVITESSDTSPDVCNVETPGVMTNGSDKLKISDIQKSTDLEFLTTKQLKYLLVVNRVDFKGCVERYELLDRATRLWTEHNKSREGTEKSNMDDTLCKICLDAPIECIFLECAHMACCIDCGKRMSECPICRQYIIRVVRCFKV